MNKTYQLIAERCLDNYWNSCATDSHGGGWDRGSNAHKFALKWAEKNFSDLKILSWKKIYKLYQKQLVQE